MSLRRLDVDVTLHVSCGGKVEPKSLYYYKTGEWIPIVQVLRADKAANLKVGGRGVRYRCVTLEGMAGGAPVQRQRTLWREGDQWFVEEEVPDGPADVV